MDEFFRRFFGELAAAACRSERAQRSLGSGVIVDAERPRRHQQPRHREHERGHASRSPTGASSRRRSCCAIRAPTSRCSSSRTRQDLVAIAFGDSDEPRGRRLRAGDRQPLRRRPDGDAGHRLGAGAHAGRRRRLRSSSSRPTRPINPGNSGGALVDMQGRLVGINTAIYSQSGGSHGIGFAIPAEHGAASWSRAPRPGRRRCAGPGSARGCRRVTADIADELGLDRPTGVLVGAACSREGPGGGGGPAARRRDPHGRRRRPSTTPRPSATASPRGRSAARPRSRSCAAASADVIPVKLGPAPETRPREPVDAVGPLAAGGRDRGQPVAGGGRGAARSMPAPRASSSARSTRAAPAARVGFQKGDIILALNGERMATHRAMSRPRCNERKRAWEVTISRGGQSMTSVFPG